MVDSRRRGRLDLFPSPKVNNMLEDFTQLIIMILYHFVICFQLESEMNK